MIVLCKKNKIEILYLEYIQDNQTTKQPNNDNLSNEYERITYPIKNDQR